MKWLKRMGAVIAIVIVGDFAYAHRPQAGHNQARVVVDRPAAQVFRYFADYEQVKRWVPMLKGVRYLHGDKFEVGAVARLTADDGEEDEEITAIEPGKRLELKLHGTQGEFDEVADYFFDEAAGKTTVRLDAQTQYHGLFVLLEPVITPTADKALDDSLKLLKSIAEKE